MNKSELRRVLLRLAATVAAAGGATALYFYAKLHPFWVSTRFLPWSRRAVHVLSAVNGWLPFSLAEILLYLLIIGLLTVLVSTIVRVCRRRSPPFAIVRLISRLLLAAGLAMLFYEGVWAAGYHALPLSVSLGYELRGYTREELAGAAEWMLEAANAEAGNVARDENGVMLDIPTGELRRMTRESWEALAAGSDYFASFRPVTVKPVLASELMSYADITGIFIAFTGEANVNVSSPASSTPYTAAHELAHASMVCPENEANFAAWLACRASSYSEFRYSGALSAFVYLYNSLYGVDREAAFALYERLDPQIIADFAYRAEYWDAHKGWLERFSNAANDAYLKVMAQPNGVRSYGMVSDLLIAEYLRSSGGAY